ncbi:MAG: hypothetical protein AAGF11_39550 [Myxococcota bacterium]
MNTSSMTLQSFQTTLLALGMTLSLGCDSTDSDESPPVEDLAAALELSPNQDLVELEGSDAIAFEAVESDEPFDIKAEAQSFGANCTLLRPAAWFGPNITCAEYYSAPGGPPQYYPMNDGDSFITEAGHTTPAGGSGSARIRCNNGTISIQSLGCFGGGNPK